MKDATKRIGIIIVLTTSVLVGSACAENSSSVITIPLWPDGPPNDNGLTGPENVGSCIGNISRPTLTVHLPPKDKATGGAIVITPGGGYSVVCDDTEGKQIAHILVPRGIAAIIVKYRLPNRHHFIPATDARRAIRTVRHHAEKWNINPEKVGVWGFSAGGHLASTVSTVFDQGQSAARDPIDRHSSRPDFSVLFYPVISMEVGVTHGGSRDNLIGPEVSDDLVHRYSNENQVNNKTPPTFILHAADDQAVPVENSLRYYRKLVDHGVNSRLLVFESGSHGPTAFKDNPTWLPVFEEWLKRYGVM
jgi:acetyl esterase/lipase